MDYRDPISIPLPKTDDEFERLCLLIARDRYGAEYYRYAQKGQKQYGIDIYSAYYNGGCLQCKLHKREISDAELIRELKADLQAAKRKFVDLKQFIFAVSVETRPKIQDVCKELSDDNLKVTPWFWNQLQEDIARSNWLLRYYLNYAPGAQWISNDFAKQKLKEGDKAGWQPLQFYSSNTFAQWYGILKNWDAQRQHYKNICQAITSSFADVFSDIPVAAIIRGEGGTGKSVLLRRIALELRNDYTVYWIADNAEEFLNNEWIYDIENNPNEKYLLILEDWYRNFAKTEDLSTANKLLQKVKNKTNVRLLIGDRPSNQVFYPHTEKITFDLKSEENAALLPYIFDQIPEWKDKFSEEQKEQLLKTGLFQLLFVYQYADSSTFLPKAGNYFLEIIQSDYKQLCKSDYAFYKGLAQALYVSAHLYTEYSLRLSPEAIITLAENYSGVNRPFELQQNISAVIKDSVIKRYIEIVSHRYESGEFFYCNFLHDTLADEGWKFVRVDSRRIFSFSTIIEIAEILKNEKTKNDLSEFLYWIVKSGQEIFTLEQIFSICDFLIDSRCEFPFHSNVLYMDEVLIVSDDMRLNYLERIIDIGINLDSTWSTITTWARRKLSKTEQLTIYKRLVEGGNDRVSVLGNFYRLLDENDLEKIASPTFIFELLKSNYYQSFSRELLKRILNKNKNLKDAARNYLQLDNSHTITSSFILCLQLLRKEIIAKEKAREYLLLPESWRRTENFTVCLQLLKDESIAKEKAREYLLLPDSWRISQNFAVCLQLLKDESIAKEKAREYLQLPDAEKSIENFSICLKILDEEASEIAEDILKSPIEKQDFRLIYRALQIASKVEKLDMVAEDMVIRILKSKPKYCDSANRSKFYFYLQMMNVPLFRIPVWQKEVDKLLYNYKTINRSLFYYLTISHIDKPQPLAGACLFFIRNWKQEFSRPKRYWGYFIRSIAHPIIQEKPELKIAVQHLCKEMLLADNCPPELKLWLRSISEDSNFPRWKIEEGDV